MMRKIEFIEFGIPHSKTTKVNFVYYCDVGNNIWEYTSRRKIFDLISIQAGLLHLAQILMVTETGWIGFQSRGAEEGFLQDKCQNENNTIQMHGTLLPF